MNYTLNLEQHIIDISLAIATVGLALFAYRMRLEQLDLNKREWKERMDTAYLFGFTALIGALYMIFTFT